MTNSNRTPAGVPTGGQFAASTRAEAEVNLAQPSEDDLDFARETLGPNASEDEVRNLAEQRLDRDEPERCGFDASMADEHQVTRHEQLHPGCPGAQDDPAPEQAESNGHRCWYCPSPGPHEPNQPAHDPHVYKSSFEALSQINADQPEPTADQSYCDVGRHQQCSGYTEDEFDAESCMCNCHDEHLR